MRADGTSERAPAAASNRTDAFQAAGVVGAAWLLSIGFDVLLHAGLLASLYVEASPFLLPPGVALRRIPLGYLSQIWIVVGLIALGCFVGTVVLQNLGLAPAVRLAN